MCVRAHLRVVVVVCVCVCVLHAIMSATFSGVSLTVMDCESVITPNSVSYTHLTLPTTAEV